MGAAERPRAGGGDRLALRRRRLAIPAIAVGALALAAGVGAIADYKQKRDDLADLDDLRALRGGPIFFVGEEFEELPLTRADMRSGGDVAVFDYGSCDPGPDSGCGPPLEIQNIRCGNGRTGVAIFAEAGRARRVQGALRPVNAAARRTRPMISLDRNDFAGGC